MAEKSYSISGGAGGSGKPVDVHNLMSLAKDAYAEQGFDAIGELLEKYVDHYDVNSRVKTFVKADGDLLGFVVKKLGENKKDLEKEKVPYGPSGYEPGSVLASNRGYEGWFALIGKWTEKTAEFLDKKVIGKYEHIRDLETQSDAEFEKYHEGKGKRQFLQERVFKRLAWEGEMIVKEAIDAIYNPSRDDLTAIKILSRVPGITCGDTVSFSVLQSDPKAQAGIILDPEAAHTLDEKLNDAKFRTKFEFYNKWNETKDDFVEGVMPKLHAMYERAVMHKVASMDTDELKFRYYQKQSLGELLGKEDSINVRMTELGSQTENLQKYNEELSKGRDAFDEQVAEKTERVRKPKLMEIDEKLTLLEKAHPEIAYFAKEIFPESSSDGHYHLVLRADDNPYISLRNELKDRKDRKGKGWAVDFLIKDTEASLEKIELELGIKDYRALEERRSKLEAQFSKCEETLKDQLKELALDSKTPIIERAVKISSFLKYNSGSLDKKGAMHFERIGGLGNKIAGVSRQQKTWREAHGVEEYAKLASECKAITKEEDYDFRVLQEASLRIYNNNRHLDSMKKEMEQLSGRLVDVRQPAELREMLWGTGRHENATSSMKTFRRLYSEVEVLMPEASREKLAEERRAIDQREKYLTSHPTSREKIAAAKERYRRELDEKKKGASDAIPSLSKAEKAVLSDPETVADDLELNALGQWHRKKIE